MECITKHLDGLFYKLKDVRHVPERGNFLENKKIVFYHHLNYYAANLPILYMMKLTLTFISQEGKAAL